MNKVRKECYWYSPDYDMGATIDDCALSESWSCPCSDDCKWYISTENVNRLIAQLVGAKEIYKEKYDRNDR